MQNYEKSNVLIIEDKFLVREGILTVIRDNFHVGKIMEANNVKEAVHKVKHSKVDLVIFDLNLKNRGKIEFLRLLKRLKPELKIIMILNSFNNMLFVECLIKSGVDGVIVADDAKEEFISSLSVVLSGGSYICKRISLLIAKVSLGLVDNKETLYCKLNILSKRELEILKFISHGYSTKEISKKLFLGVTTISTYKLRIKDKLELDSSSDLNKIAIKWKENLEF